MMGLVPRKTISCLRTLRGASVGGFSGKEESVPFEIHGSVQSVNDKDIANVPGGKLYTSFFWIYTKDYIPEGDSYETDKFLANGIWCTIVKYRNWENNIINHKPLMVGK